MKLAKILVLSLAVMLVAAAAHAGATYDKVMKDKLVRVGIMTDSIPGAFYNDKGEWVGFDVDMSEEIVKRLGAKIERVAVNNKTRIAFVQEGRIDMSEIGRAHV